MIRIDTDLISYLGDIIIPKNLDYDIDRIKKKRFAKLKMKRQLAEIEVQKKRNHIFGGKGNKIQIVDYQEDQQEEQPMQLEIQASDKFMRTQNIPKDLKN